MLLTTIAELRASLRDARCAARTIGLVPTMGALHAGHLALIEQARCRSHCVVVTIFVNPLQFDHRDDYERYARTLREDLAACDRLGVDLVFAPAAEEMYPRAQRTAVEVERLPEHLCGRFRPGHFRGVATIVAKLFNIVQPDLAFFGEKDAQQLAIIRRMVKDLNMPLEIVAVPTVRDQDGLALSSRNARLSPEERRRAPLLYRALTQAAREIESGADAERARGAALAVLSTAPEMRVEYFEVVDAEEMQPLERIAGEVLVAAAIWLGSTRLIDNVRVTAP